MSSQLTDTNFDSFVDDIKFLVARFEGFLRVRCGFLLEEATRGYPNLMACRDSFPGFVEDGFGTFWCFETG
jgi:hypothetical protein